MALFLMACSETDQKPSPKDEPSGPKTNQIYHKESGLLRFVEELDLPTADTTFLIIANDKSCNCGTAGIFEVDSMVQLHGNYPRIWVVNDGAPTFKDSLKPGDLLINGREYELKNYGFSGIYPQLFTLADGRLIAYNKLVFKR
jgi:hypothetical protein